MNFLIQSSSSTRSRVLISRLLRICKCASVFSEINHKNGNNNNSLLESAIRGQTREYNGKLQRKVDPRGMQENQLRVRNGTAIKQLHIKYEILKRRPFRDAGRIVFCLFFYRSSAVAECARR